ncbi:MAG: PmoA family protein [Cyclobacteriaceae bacterium]
MKLKGLIHLIQYLFIFMPVFGMAQRLATIEVETDSDAQFAFPITIDLDAITQLADSTLSLVESKENKLWEVAHQVENENGRKLVWMIRPDGVNEKRRFEIHNKKATENNGILSLEHNSQSLIIRRNQQDLWQYNHAVAEAPEGADPAYARSGFVHPMWSPTGKSLTRIQPPDHYHHYGLWNPWTRVEFQGETIDFWNLKERQGTVRFANVITKNVGQVYAGYKVLHEHVVLKNELSPKVALKEVQGTKIFMLEGEEDYYLADISILLNCATDDPVLLKEYRYGSLGWRTTEKWDRYNSEVITSEGLNRKNADGSLARWCIVQGEIDEDYAAVIMMSYPTNYNHPEPLRIWPEDQYDRGDMYANFAPTKNMDWDLQPGINYVLNYRFLVSSKKLSAEDAESAWKQFAKAPAITIQVD